MWVDVIKAIKKPTINKIENKINKAVKILIFIIRRLMPSLPRKASQNISIIKIGQLTKLIPQSFPSFPSSLLL